MRFFTLACALALTWNGVRAQDTEPLYKDPTQPIEVRTQDLLSRMTPDEKFWQLFMIPGDLSQDMEKYKDGIFGFQIGAAEGDGATGQILRYSPESNAYEMAAKINEIQKYFF